MRINDYLNISKYINDCPSCKYAMIGADEETGEFHGSLELKEEVVTRKCKCGFEITIDSNNGTTKGKLKKQIDKALEEFNSK